jgi:uncharacterized protein
MIQVELLDNTHLAAILIFFCVVQSVFGMGLLVFGTPTLILLNVPFLDCLLLLVPASLTISLMQIGSVSTFRNTEIGGSIHLLICAVAVGFLVHFLPIGPVRLEGLIGVVLLGYGLSRMSARVEAVATRFVRRRFRAMTAAMGILHGASNMGGAILAILSTSRFSDKGELRLFVAANYAVLAASQMLVLVFVLDQWPLLSIVASSSIALVAYLSLGRHAFRAIGSHAFQHLFTGFIFMYAVALLWKYSQTPSVA